MAVSLIVFLTLISWFILCHLSVIYFEERRYDVQRSIFRRALWCLDLLSNTALNRNENEIGKAEKNHKIYAN